MQINGLARVHSPQLINAPHRTAPAQPAGRANPAFGADELDISPQAQAISQIREIPDIRADRVAAIREAIASGEYETDAKLDIALDRLLDEIG